MSETARIYGVMAEFADSEAIIAAAKNAYEAGYRQMDAYTPFPVEGLAENLTHKRSKVPLIVLLAGIAGGGGGYFMEWYATGVSYPINVGGRPLNSWPAYVPITFELTVLAGALAAIGSMLALNLLPQPYHPVFNSARFERASTDKFFLCIESTDPKFDAAATRRFLESLHPEQVEEVFE